MHNIVELIALNIGIIAMCGLVLISIYSVAYTVHHYVWCWFKERELEQITKDTARLMADYRQNKGKK
jgi:hypothetical protein|tara:strand:+ start:197 stop:397 length:201 start_codon:yes stop_codon:yes gene_type:complete